MRKFLAIILCFCLMAPLALPAGAVETTEPYLSTLSEVIHNREHCRYVQMMTSYHLRNDPAIQRALEDGYSAVFLFEGCSDNMDDPELRDISYYRVSAVCVAVRLDENGEPYLAYFSGDCSTLPDRPLEYGAWELEDVGEVGPATICDGTYALYTVRHGGAYEAMQVRTSRSDDTIPAVYMNPEGYVRARANQINIHTRTGNHTIQGAMWSAGCILVGDGDFGKFSELMESTYYALYERFSIGNRIGTLTVDRQNLKEEMYELYENEDAVDMLLAVSRHLRPQAYLERCGEAETYAEPLVRWAMENAELMSLPCSNDTDARSVLLDRIPEGTEIEILGSISNTAGNRWYEIEWKGERGYLYSGYAKQPNWYDRLTRWLFG